jgi:hypothetical protein
VAVDRKSWLVHWQLRRDERVVTLVVALVDEILRVWHLQIWLLTFIPSWALMGRQDLVGICLSTVCLGTQHWYEPLLYGARQSPAAYLSFLLMMPLSGRVQLHEYPFLSVV